MNGHVTETATQEAAGAIEAQQALDGISEHGNTVDHAWLGFVQVASRFGWRSPAARAYVVEIAKRAAA